MRRTNEKRIEKMNLSIFLCKYKICSIFLLLTLCAIAPSVFAAQSFCQIMANVKPSTPFSFEKQVSKLQGFSYFNNNLQLYMFYDEFFHIIDEVEMNQKPENLQIFKNAFFSMFDIKDGFLKRYFVKHFSSDEHYEGMYFLDSNAYFPFNGHIIKFALSNKRCMAFDSGLLHWIRPQTIPIKLITDSLNKNMKVYVVSVDPVAKKGIIIYKFWYSGGTFYNYEFTYKVISDARDMESESYFYLQLTSDPRSVRFVHPKKGNVTRAQLYPLAQQAMPGYLFKQDLYLFDVDLACVHIIFDYHLFDLNELFKQETDFLLMRRNIPFEKFFICEDKYDIPNKFSFLSPDRCDKTISSSGGQIEALRSDTGGRNVDANDNTTDDNVVVWTGSNEESSNKTFFVIMTILVVICSVVLCSFLIWRQKKKNKNSKNQSNVEKARSKKTTSVDKMGGAGGDLKVSSKSKSKIKQRSQQSSGGGVSSKKSAKSSKSSTSTPVTVSSAGGVPAKSHSSSTGIRKQPSTKK